ncbi:hypothetical protein N0V95_003897 [Ascochyta clinopodiicola]|nr:hypothetical protein N0V95_003897 [Ascochyta clinopodiicola]
MDFIEQAARKGEAKRLKLHDLAKKVGLTPRYFHKIFKDKTGTTPREYTNIVAAQQNGLSPGSGSDSSLLDMDSFDWDTFDISELAEYQFDSSAPLDDDFMTQAAQISAAGFVEAPQDGTPLQPWVRVPGELDTSDSDSTLSIEQLPGFNGKRMLQTDVGNV